MTTLYIDRKDIELSVSNGVIEVREPTGRRGTVPLARLERVVLRGRAKISTSALGAITNAGAGVLVLSGRHNRHLATCVGRPHNDVVRRLGQFDAYQDATARTQWALALISAKVHAQRRLLQKALNSRPDKRRKLTRSIAQLDALRTRAVEDGARLDIPSLRGIEGAAAAAYFKGFAVLFPPSLGFEHRNRRPPRDPVNACLSLGYTLLHFEATLACHAAGLDPLLGLYHEPAYGRESLAADIVDPFRPHVDEWVWALFRDRVLTKKAFREADGGTLLGKAGRRHFYRRFNPLACALRRLLRRQLARLARELGQRGRSLAACLCEGEGE